MESTKTATVYLIESDKEIVYVGCTTKSLHRRWLEHCKLARHGLARPLYERIRRDGKDAFTIRSVFCGSIFEARQKEVAIIAECRRFGIELLQSNRGGGGVRIPSAEERLRLSEITKQLWTDPEFRERTLKGMLEVVRDPERRAKHSKFMKKHMRERWQDPQYREKGLAQIKRVNSDPKNREKMRQLWKDPEFRAQQRKSRSEGQKRRWARAGERERQRAKHNDPAVRSRKSEAAKRNAERPEIKAKLIAAAKKGAAVRWGKVLES